MKRSASMKNLRNPAATYVVPFEFNSLQRQCSSLFSKNFNNGIDDPEKQRTARQSLHRYIFIICHTIQHFGHHLTANELDLVQSACEETLHWMWHDEIKSLEDYRLQITQLLRICTPLMKRLFRVEQQMANVKK